MNEFIEIFDRDTLNHIVKHQNYYESLLSKDKEQDEVYAQFSLYKKYLKLASGSSGNMVAVKYNKKNGEGRLFAKGSLSLQSFHSKVRGSIASDLYYDVDIVNAHPTMLEKICNLNGKFVPFLQTYIISRDSIIKDVIESNKNIDKSYVKKMIISIIYGGNEAYEKLDNKTNWIRSFKEEMESVHDLVPTWFPDAYNTRLNKKEFNVKGSTLSLELCKLENDILQCMVGYLKSKKLYDFILVLCFDGVMINKTTKLTDEILEKHMRNMEVAICERFNINIKLAVKEFSKLPMEIPDEFIKQTNLEIKEPINIKSLYRDSKYYWYDFVKDMTRYTFESKGCLIDKFKTDINKVMIRVYHMDDHIIRKISKNIMFQFDKKIPTQIFSYFDIKPNGKKTKCKMTLKKLLNDVGLINDVATYDKLTFKPCGTDEKFQDSEQRDFNTWTGFQASIVKEVDMTLVEPLLNHIKKVWVSDNEEHYRYMLSWFKIIFTKPDFKTKVAVVLKSSQKQIGKGMFISDFLIPFVFGDLYAMSIAGLDSVTSRFNQILMNKILINCDELSTIDGSYHQSFDVLKKRITDKTLKVEIKGGKSFIYPDYSNYIMCTNNEFTIRIETNDCRYFAVECSPCYKGNFEYFNKLASLFTQKTADHFFTYISQLTEGIVEIRNVPMTNLKREMVTGSLTSPIRFLLSINDNGLYCDKCASENECQSNNCKCKTFWITSSKLYAEYIRWCETEKEHTFSHTKFGTNIREYIDKKKSSCVKYDLKTINIVL